MKLDEYLVLLESRLSPELYLHSLGVGKSAADLARCYGEDPQRAYLTGILHDYGKRYNPETLLHYAGSRGLHLDEITRKEPSLLHAPLGVELLQEELGLEDATMLEAIRYHTTGSPGLSLLGKIIFLADAIEDGRDYPGVKELRKLARLDLTEALLTVTENTIKLVLEKRGFLHPHSVFFRNELLCEIKEAGERR